jgi:RimJ/RimL family protein N-acetyltransferase
MTGQVLGPDELRGEQVVLVPVGSGHVAELRRILLTPEVRARWGDEAASPDWPFDDPSATRFAILVEGSVRGMVQYSEENEPGYRHASIDIFLDPVVHGRGLGRDAVRVLARHLIRDRGHHRIVIDPAADNAAAIRCYAAVGFRPVGVMRRYERDADGAEWHDGLLMDLLAEELALEAGEAGYQAPGFRGSLFLGEVAGAWHYATVDVVEAGGSESAD